MKEAVLGKDRNPGTERGLREADMKREREFALFFFYQQVWQLLLLCSHVLFVVVGVITHSPGQKMSPLCLIWKAATAPPTAGAGRLFSNMVLGIMESSRSKSIHKWWLGGPGQTCQPGQHSKLVRHWSFDAQKRFTVTVQ